LLLPVLFFLVPFFILKIKGVDVRLSTDSSQSREILSTEFISKTDATIDISVNQNDFGTYLLAVKLDSLVCSLSHVRFADSKAAENYPLADVGVMPVSVLPSTLRKVSNSMKENEDIKIRIFK
jgi:hypothetical protein